MNVMNTPTPAPDSQTTNAIIKLAVLAVGGQGGGVLTGWIEQMARAQGYDCQATSVAGVAQRTGSTIYYLEMLPRGDVAPVFCLAPAGGDVDVMIAAELMEAGRAIMRGFVTPDRTTLIASTHRALAVSEKMVPGDGIARPDEVMAAAQLAADRLIAFDMERLAVENGSVISATLFGALAGSGALPFPREAFEEAIRAGGKGVEASLRAFGAAYEAAQSDGDRTVSAPLDTPPAPAPEPQGPARAMKAWQKLTARIGALPAPAQPMARAGLEKVVDFIDLAYGAQYLDRVEQFAARDSGSGDLAREAAKYVANAMAYDDVIRVADLKTRASRLRRIEGEMGAGDAQLMQLTEFLHPRAEEIVGLFPARLGAWTEARPKWMARIDRMVNKGRRMRTDRMLPFLMLYVMGGLRRYRRRTHRHALEMAHIDRWLKLAETQPSEALTIEVLRCRRLIKGYSDTHVRGLSKFDRVLATLPMLQGRDDAAEWLARLREAALQDEKGTDLDGAIRTIESFA